MGRRVAQRPDWFDNDKPVDPQTEAIPIVDEPAIEEPEQHWTPNWVEPEQEPLVIEDQPHPVHSRRAQHDAASIQTKNTDLTLALLFGMAIGFFIASITYVMRYHSTADATLRDASVVFSGFGIVMSGIIAITIAVVHLWRTRKDN